MLYKLDGFLMDKVFQKFSHWFQKLTGKTCFWLTKTCYGSSLLFLVLMGVFNFLVRQEPSLVKFNIALDIIFWLLVGIIYASMIISIIRSCDREEKDFFSAKEASVNIRRITLTLPRISAFLVCSMVIGFMAVIILFFARSHIFYPIPVCLSLLFWAIFTIFAVYFRCCTPLPLCKSKVKEWQESFKKRLKPVLEGGKG